MSDEVAAFDAVGKTYGNHLVLSDLSLTVRQGEVLALLGPNGAGKTTALNILLGLRRPTSGSVRLLGMPPSSPEALDQIGVTPQDANFPFQLSVRELLSLVRAHYSDPVESDELIAAFQLANIVDQKIGELSPGQRRLVALALAFTNRSRAIFLDEPTANLDVDARKALWLRAKRYAAGGGAIFFTTHYISEVEHIATRLCVLKHGRVRYNGSVSDVRKKAGVGGRIRLRADGLPDLPAIERSEHSNGVYTLLSHDTDVVVRNLMDAKVSFSDLEVTQVPLEEAIQHLF